MARNKCFLITPAPVNIDQASLLENTTEMRGMYGIRKVRQESEHAAERHKCNNIRKVSGE